MTKKEKLIADLTSLREEYFSRPGVKKKAWDSDETDLNAIRHCVSQKLKDGWSDQDIFSYAMNLKHVNPTISEKRALRNMSQISAKYEKKG